ncbi:MAG TPA: GxxExxY protein, partial [Candidatus Acidoferrum sp.]|nr:GxxExxY protein [Candidatus Acidoferrum sp.]
QNLPNGIMKGEYDLAGKVIGLAMKVHSTLGPGFLESVYQKALAYELTKAGIRFESEKPLNVLYDGILVGEFVADFLVENELLVELKAVQTLVPAHELQTVNYLAATVKDIGLLLNFGAERLEFKKKFRPPKPKVHSEHSVHSV